MKKETTKIICMVLSLVMAFAMAACSVKQADNDAKTSAKTSTTEKTTAVTPTPSEPSTISIILSGDNTPAADNIVLKELSKRTGVNIKMIYVPSKDYSTKLSTLIASDSLPDIFPTGGNDAIEFKEAGLLAEVGDLINKYAPNIIKNVGESLPKATVNEDGIYLILDARLPYCDQINLRTDWLKNLGMEMPTDLDSLYQVYRAFTYNDPNKNGKKDTFGLAANSNPRSFSSIFGAFGIPRGRNIELSDGTVTTWVKHPKFLEAMAYIRKLNAEGLFEPDWATIPNMEMFAKLWNGQAGAIEWECVGPTNNWMPGRYIEDPPPTFDFPIIKGPDGLHGVPRANPNYTSGFAFSSKCKDLVAAVKLANYCMSDEGNELLYLGIEGTMFRWIDKENGKYEYLNEYKDPATHRAAGGFCYWYLFAPTINTEIRTFNKQTQEGVIAARNNGLPEATIIKPLKTRSEYGTELDRIIQEMYVQLIVTQEDIKSVYDKFMADWARAGGTEWEKEATEVYRQQEGK